MPTQSEFTFDIEPEALFLAIEYGLEKTAAATVRQAQRTCPVRTGTLQGSLKFDPPQDLAIEMGSFNVRYAGKVNDRTGFLTKATERHWRDLPNYIREGLG